MPPLEIIAAVALGAFIVILVVYQISEHRKKSDPPGTHVSNRSDRFDEENLR